MGEDPKSAPLLPAVLAGPGSRAPQHGSFQASISQPKVHQNHINLKPLFLNHSPVTSTRVKPENTGYKFTRAPRLATRSGHNSGRF
jgi:hypothetical protein